MISKINDLLFTFDNKIRQMYVSCFSMFILEREDVSQEKMNEIQEIFSVRRKEQENFLLFNECYPNPERN